MTQAPEQLPVVETAVEKKLDGVAKAAILLVTLGEEASAAVVKRLTDEELKKVTLAIASLQLISPQQSGQVLEEFYQATVARDFPHRGGSDYAKRMLASAFGREGGRLASELELEGSADSLAIQPLRQSDPQQLSLLIRNEHPQTVALILAHLTQVQAAALLATLPKDTRKDVSIRMARLDQIAPTVFRRISEVLTTKIKALGSTAREPVGGVRAVAEILNRMESSQSEEILVDIQAEQENLEQEIRHYMFVFEDLLMIDAKGMREIVSKVDRKLLVLGLKGTSDELKSHILGCMSTRGADMLREDIEAMGPVKIREVEGAQQQIIAVVRALQAEGIVSIGSGGGDDQYVN